MPTRSVFGVGAIVASFVSTECPGGTGMWGLFGKPLEGFSVMYGSEGGGGGSGTIFVQKLAVTVDSLGFFCLFW